MDEEVGPEPDSGDDADEEEGADEPEDEVLLGLLIGHDFVILLLLVEEREGPRKSAG